MPAVAAAVAPGPRRALQLLVAGAAASRGLSRPCSGDAVALLQTASRAQHPAPFAPSGGVLAEAHVPPSASTAAMEALVSLLAGTAANASAGPTGADGQLSADGAQGDLVRCNVVVQASPGNTARVEYDQIPEPIISSNSVFKEFTAEWGDPLNTDLRLSHSGTFRAGDTMTVQLKAELKGPSFSNALKHTYSCQVCGAACSMNYEKMPAEMRIFLPSAPPPLKMPPCPVKPGDQTFVMGDMLLPERPLLPPGYTGLLRARLAVQRGASAVGSHTLNLQFGLPAPATALTAAEAAPAPAAAAAGTTAAAGEAQAEAADAAATATPRSSEALEVHAAEAGQAAPAASGTPAAAPAPKAPLLGAAVALAAAPPRDVPEAAPAASAALPAAAVNEDEELS